MTREKQSDDREIWRSGDRMNKEAIASGGFSIHPITGLLLPFTRSSDHSISRSPDHPIRLTLTERRLYVYAEKAGSGSI